MTAFVKSVEVATHAALWLRIDDAQGKALLLDNMKRHPITDSNPWTRYEVTVTVPPDAARIAFGVLLFGSGSVYVDNVGFEVLDASGIVDHASTTSLPAVPRNLDFEN
jgi:hypothetical protein